MSNFILELKLKPELYQEQILEKRFEIGRKIYNAMVSLTQKRYFEMIKTKEYREIKQELKEIYNSNSKSKAVTKRKSELNKKLNDLNKQYRLSKNDFEKDVKFMQHHFEKNIDSFTVQKIVFNLWKAYEKLLFQNGDKIHYKKYGNMNSLEGKSNLTGIRFKDGVLEWNKLKVKIGVLNDYETEALKNNISYCRITRVCIRNKYSYFLQIILKGKPPVKINKNDGSLKRVLGNGDVGLDIGISTIAISSLSDVKILELCDKVQTMERKKRRLQRCVDRSRRYMNPDNFNNDGTIKKQGSKKVKWIKSNHYKKLILELKEISRKQAAIRKLQHETLANEILKLGDTFYVETMNFNGLAKKTKHTEKKDNGRFKKKKRFGKSIAKRAPSMLLSIIDRKLNYHDSMLNKIDTVSVKASQYNHLEDECKKKKLSQRWNHFGDIKVQRDMYSAFLIMNVEHDLKNVNKNKCNERFENFLKLHDLEVKRLTGCKNLSSIAI